MRRPLLLGTIAIVVLLAANLGLALWYRGAARSGPVRASASGVSEPPPSPPAAVAPAFVPSPGSAGTMPPPRDAFDDFREAHHLRSRARYSEAIPLYTRYLQHVPASAQAWFELGCCQNGLYQFSPALDDFNRSASLARQADIMIPNLFRERGYVYDRIGRHDLAVADLTRAIEQDAWDTLAYVYRGTANLWLHHPRLAMVDYAAATRLHPDAESRRVIAANRREARAQLSGTPVSPTRPPAAPRSPVASP